MGYARFLANYPYIIVGVVSAVCVTCLIVVVVVASKPDFSDPKLGFEARGTELSARIRSHEKLLDSTYGILTRSGNHYSSSHGRYREMKLRHNTTDKKRSRNKNYKKLRYKSKDIYDIDNSTRPFFCDIPRTDYARYTFTTYDNSNLLTLENIQSMCKMDDDISEKPSFHKHCVRVSNTDRQCCRTWSLGNYVALLTNHTSCIELTNTDIEIFRDMLTECVVYYDLLSVCSDGSGDTGNNAEQCKDIPPKCLDHNAIYHVLHYIADINVMTKERSGHTIKLTYAMTFIPLAIGKSTENLYNDLTDKIGLTYKDVKIVAVNFGLKQIMFDEYLKKDSVWFVLALTVILAVMWFYTASIFITIMAIISIIITLVISYFIYSIIFEIDFFPYMNLMAVVLLIGVGVDDVFLYCRIWNLAKFEKNVGTLEKVISDTLKHATLSMFVTSVTTAGALYANIVSKITAIRCFAIFGGTTVIVNFILMITWTPATIVLHDKWCSDCCFCHNLEHYSSKKGACYQIYKYLYKIYLHISEGSRIFFEKLLPYVIIKLRYLWITVFSLLSILGIIAVLYYPKLKLPSSNEFQMFAHSHPFEVYDFQIKDQFWFEKAAGTSKATVPLTVVWGIEPTDTGNKLNPYSKTELKYSHNFDVKTQEGQRYFLKFCRDLRSSQWYQIDVGPQVARVNCFIEGFRQFMERPCRSPVGSYKPCCEESVFPFSQHVYSECLDEWMNGVENSRHLFYVHPNAGPRFSKETGEIVAIIAEFNSKQPYSFNYESMKEFYNSMNKWVNLQTTWAPIGFKHAWFVSDLSFYDLQQSIAKGTPIAIGVSVAIATVFAFLTTLNVLITIWAMITITGTIFTVVGVLVLIGWELNIMESVTITVAIGLAIDFTLHYGMAYRLSPDMDREARMLCATQRVGSVVSMAAFSTFLAGIIMLPSTIAAYRQLGVFLIIIMSFSWLYATFFFQSLLRVFGPYGGFSQFHWPTIHCDTCLEQEHVDKTVYTVSDSLSSSSTNNQGNSNSETHELEPLTEEEEHKGKSNHLSRSHSTSITTVSSDKNRQLNGNSNIRSEENEETCISLLSDDTSLKSGPKGDVVCVDSRVLNNGNSTTGPIYVLAQVEREDLPLELTNTKDSPLSVTKHNGSNNNVWVKNEIFV